MDLGTLLSLAAMASAAALFWAVALRRAIERRTRELQDQRQSLHTLVSTLPDLVFVKDLKGVYRACNPAFERAFGKPEAQIIGRTDHSLTHAELADALRQHDLDALAAGRPLMSEDWLTHATDGAKALFETIKAPMRDASGRVIGVLGIARDVTRQRHAEQRLRRLNQLYQVLGRVQDATHVQGDPSSLYAAICQAVVEEGGMTLAWIGSTDARRETLRPVQRAGDTLQPLPPLRIGNLQRPGWSADEPGRSGSSATAALQAWREGRTALIQEVPTPVLDTGADPNAGGAWLALPIKVNTEVRAVLCMRAEQADRFDAEEVGVLERLAKQVSLRLTADEAEAARQKVVSALRDSEARFSLMFQTSPVGMLLEPVRRSPDQSASAADVNQAWLDLFGYQRSEIVGAAVLPPSLWADPAQQQSLMDELQENGRVSGRELRLRRRSGEQVDIAYSATQTSLGGQAYRLASFVDITLQKHATRRAEEEAGHLEHEVARRTAELNHLFNALPDLYFRLSPEGVVLDYRPGKDMPLPQVPAHWLGHTLDQVLPPRAAETIAAAITQVSAGQQPVSVEYAQGTRTFEARIVPTAPGGDLVAVVRDVSERHALEAEREAAREDAEQQARHRSEFLATMSHEIRTPLNAILGFAQLGHEQTRGNKAQEGYSRILSAGRLLLAIVNDVLDYSKIEARRMDVESIPASPRQLIDATADMVRDAARQKGLQLRVHIAPELPMACMTDPTRLQQILANLLSNAVKFTHRGGIDLMADREGHDGGDWLRIRVHDSGIGMNAGQREALFAPFRQADASTTRRYGGTGLGLAISRQLAELMGGELTVQSTLGVGSEFSLRLPLRAVPASWQQLGPVEEAPAACGPQLQGLRLLVAEDNPVNQIVIKQALSSAGADVTLAADGREAVDQVSAHPDHFDAVLMDIQMPEMDGYEATRRIRRLAPALPVIGQTAHALQEERDQCLACGMVAHVAKPIDLPRLIATLRAVMRQPVS